MEIQKLRLSDIEPANYNPRRQLTPEDPQYQKLENSIKAFGYVEPIIWNRQTGHLVGGHQRLTILRNQGIEEAEVTVVDLPLHDEKMLNLLLNRAKGHWDNDKLASLLNELNEIDAVELTGFDSWELQGMFDGLNNDLNDILNYSPSDNAEPEQTQTFDITFSIPIEYQSAVNAYLDTQENALDYLAEAVVLLVEGVIDDEN